MLLRSLTLRDFRNIAEARVEFAGKRQFFVGSNGQGKTNLLEAAGCLTALRSFRTTDTGVLVLQGAAEAGVGAEIEHERRGATRLVLRFRADGKEVEADGVRVGRLADHLGHFPLVAFSSQDLQWVRGAPALRRRWLDLTLAAMDAGYLRALQNYTRALAGRNRLLKTGGGGVAELKAFEEVLAPAAAEVVQVRRKGVEELAAAAAEAYRKVSEGEEPGTVAYAGEGAPEAGEAGYWRGVWEAGRAADLRMRNTIKGPHKDDLRLEIKGGPAREFGSEGQQRALVLALRLAQASWFQAKSGIRPVILADDVLGELDPARRKRFWSALDPAAQVLATGTTLPGSDLGTWQRFEVTAGTFTAV